MSTFFDQLLAHLSVDQLAQGVAARLPSAFAALLVVVTAFLVWRGLARGLDAVFKRVDFDRTGAEFVLAISRFVIVVVTILMVLAQFGINTTSVLASLGVAGLTIGFAARDALSNIISGLFIFWDRPFVLGDLVEVDDQYGRVENITLRSTRLVTPDGRMVSLANSVVVNAKLTSYTNFPSLRLDVGFTVGVDEDLDRVREVLLEVVKGRPGFLDTPAPVVVLTACGDFNLTVELRAWIADEKAHVAERHALREAAYRALYDAGVDMPVETLQLKPLKVENAA